MLSGWVVVKVLADDGVSPGVDHHARHHSDRSSTNDYSNLRRCSDNCVLGLRDVVPCYDHGDQLRTTQRLPGSCGETC